MATENTTPRKKRNIQLSIKADDGSSYLPSWGIREGLREIIQNARDAEVQYGAPLRIEWYKGNTGRETLRITNEGCNLQREALLLGHTSKSGQQELIGRFGEGLKLGLLALVRAGVKVKVFTGNDEDMTGEIWVPEIQKSETFNANVLSISIRDAEYRKRVRIEIEGVEKSDWDYYSSDYLFLPGNKKGEVIKTSHGEILLDPIHVGRIYVKGIFVEKKDTEFGYNLFDVELDRDRKMINSYSFDQAKTAVIDEAVRNRGFSVAKVLDLLERGADDVDGYSLAYTLTQDTLNQLKTEFLNKHGSNAFPVRDSGQVTELGHLNPNLNPVLVSYDLALVMKKVFGTFEEIKQRLANETLYVYGIGELQTDERDNLIWATAMVNKVLPAQNMEPLSLGSIAVCDFRKDTLRGLFDPANGQIKLSKKIMSNRTLTLRVLIHEVAHNMGADAEKSHVSTMESIWEAIMASLITAK